MGMVLHRPTDSNLPGARPARPLGPGSQLYVRTARYAYTLYLHKKVGCRCTPPAEQILDETLFDHHADAGEATNLAYEPAHAHTREALLQLVRREWGLPSDIGWRPPNRSLRIAQIDDLTRCWTTVCLQPSRL